MEVTDNANEIQRQHDETVIHSSHFMIRNNQHLFGLYTKIDDGISSTPTYGICIYNKTNKKWEKLKIGQWVPLSIMHEFVTKFKNVNGGKHIITSIYKDENNNYHLFILCNFLGDYSATLGTFDSILVEPNTIFHPRLNNKLIELFIHGDKCVSINFYEPFMNNQFIINLGVINEQLFAISTTCEGESIKQTLSFSKFDHNDKQFHPCPKGGKIGVKHCFFTTKMVGPFLFIRTATEKSRIGIFRLNHKNYKVSEFKAIQVPNVDDVVEDMAIAHVQDFVVCRVKDSLIIQDIPRGNVKAEFIIYSIANQQVIKTVNLDKLNLGRTLYGPTSVWSVLPKSGWYFHLNVWREQEREDLVVTGFIRRAQREDNVSNLPFALIKIIAYYYCVEIIRLMYYSYSNVYDPFHLKSWSFDVDWFLSL